MVICEVGRREDGAEMSQLSIRSQWQRRLEFLFFIRLITGAVFPSE